MDSFFALCKDPAFIALARNNEDAFNILETSLLMYDDYKNLMSSYSLGRHVMFAVKFGKMFAGGSLTSMIIASTEYKDFIDYLQEIVKSFQASSTASLEIQSMEHVASEFLNRCDDFENFKKTEFFHHFYELYSHMVAFGMIKSMSLPFSRRGMNLVREQLLDERYFNASSFVYTAMKTVCFLYTRGIQCYRLGRIDPILHNGPAYVDWMDAVSELKDLQPLIQNCAAHGVDEHKYRRDVSECLEKGQAIYEVVRNQRFHPSTRHIRNYISDLKAMKAELVSDSFARKYRDPPFSILLNGESAVGKTFLSDIIFYRYGRKFKPECMDRVIDGVRQNPKEYLYVRHPTAKFWDGFKSEKWCVLFDDIAFVRPGVSNEIEPAMQELLQVGNPLPYSPDQAKLEDKGKTPLRCELLLATTNTKNINAYHYFNHAPAVQRRFQYIITPTVKPEYQTQYGNLDSSKLTPIEDGLNDAWNFIVETVDPRKVAINSPARLTKLVIPGISSSEYTFTNIYDFWDWLGLAMDDHKRTCGRIDKANDTLFSVELCLECDRPLRGCKCLQSSDTPDVWAWPYILSLNLLRILGWLMVTILATLPEKWMMWRALHCYQAFQRYWLLDLGKSVQVMTSHPRSRQIAVAAAALIGMYAAYAFFREDDEPKVQGNTQIGVGPKPKKNERQNPWYSDSFELSSFDLSRPSLSSNGLSHNEARQNFSRHVVRICISYYTDLGEKRWKTTTGICLMQSYYLVNLHAIPGVGQGERIQIVSGTKKEGVSLNFEQKFCEADVCRVPHRDLAILKLNSLPPRLGLHGYMLPKPLYGLEADGLLISRNPGGDVVYRDVKRVKRTEVACSLKDYTGDFLGGDCAQATVSGDCGSPLIFKTAKGYFVAGIHVMRHKETGKVFSIPLDQQFFKPYLEHFGSSFCSAPNLSSSSIVRQLGPLHSKSVFRYIDHGTAEVFGSFQGFRPTPKSTVCATPIQDRMVAKGYSVKYTAPEMRGWKPWRLAALDMVSPISDIDTSVVRMCAEAYFDDVFSVLGSDALQMLEVYDDFTCLNGALGVTGVEKINRNTSAGAPWRKSKRFFLSAIPEERGLPEPVEASEEIMDRVQDCIAKYHRGESYSPVFTAHLKDEPVTFAKAEMGKTRVFTGAPLDWSIVVRKYTLSFIRLMMNNRLAFEAAPGTVAQSHEWTELHDYITKHGVERIVAGDYKSFDKKMSPIFMEAAFRIIHRFCDLSGNFSPQDLKCIEGICTDTIYPLVDFNGDLVRFYGSNPSGHPLTVVLNSIVNSLYMRYAYYLLNPERTVATFKQHVSLMTYGDDNIMSVSHIASWFNHTAIVGAFAQLGIVYTMADKNAESVPYIHMDDATFLRRGWRWSDAVRGYLAPLDHDSIEKMLTVWVKSKSVEQPYQLRSVITSAVREYFFYGEEVYNVKSKLLRHTFIDVGFGEYIEPYMFPAYQELVDEFMQNSADLLQTE